MKLYGAGITAVASAVPEKIMTNKDLEKMVNTNNEWIVSRTGICERRIAEPNIATSDLAIAAARKVLAKSDITAADLDLIIVATVTPDYQFPAAACLVQSELEAWDAAAFDLAAGCSGFIYALGTGSQFIKTGQYKNILVIGVDVLSRIIDWTDRTTCILFGDGAGAALLQPVEAGEGVLSLFMGADGCNGRSLMVPAGGTKMPASLETVKSGLHYVKMSGNEIFKHAVKEMERSVMKALEGAGLDKEDIDFLVPHQANARIIDLTRKRMGLPKEKVLINIDKYGNMSAGSIPVALDEAISDGKIKSGSIVCMVAFGAGLTWGACIVKWK